MNGYRYHVTLCIGQPHPITVYGTGFGVCVVLVLSVISIILIFIMIIVTIVVIFMAILYFFNYIFTLSVTE